MASIHKKNSAIARDLVQRLTVRTSLTIVAGTDSNGCPTIAIGAGSPGGQNAFIRLLELPSIGTNAVGNSQDSYGPSVAQLVLETSTIANVELLTVSNQWLLLGELFRVGMEVDLYLSANGTAPVIAGITGTPAATFNNLYMSPMMGM
jgi:hypothetical protein